MSFTAELASSCGFRVSNCKTDSARSTVDGAIHSAAGPSLYDECKLLNGAETGEVKLTTGHDLPAKHIAHAVGPIYSSSRKEHCEEMLRSCYRTTLELAVQNELRSVVSVVCLRVSKGPCSLVESRRPSRASLLASTATLWTTRLALLWMRLASSSKALVAATSTRSSSPSSARWTLIHVSSCRDTKLDHTPPQTARRWLWSSP